MTKFETKIQLAKLVFATVMCFFLFLICLLLSDVVTILTEILNIIKNQNV